MAWLAPSGEVTIARIARDGLRTFRPSAPHHVTFLPFDFGDAVAWVPEAHAAWIAKIDAAVVLVCSSNEANAYVVRDGVITDAGVAPYLHAFAPVEDAGVAVGYDIDGTLWAFDGEAFYEVAEDGKLHGLAWYPPLSTIVSLRPAGEDRMVLAAWQDEGFVDVEPEIATTTYRSGGRLAVTRDLRIVYYGGQDFEKQGSPTSSALVSAPGGTTMERDYEIHEISCPYYQIGVAHPEVCTVDQTLISKMLALPVSKVQCILSGGAHCTYVVQSVAVKN